MDLHEAVLEGGAPWGIRLQGGSDYNTPLKIAQVTPGSKAALNGVLAGSEVFEINGNKTEYLSMSQAQTLIKVTGEELVLSLKIQSDGPDTKYITMGGGRPWGLRLQGGKNSGSPLQVAQVTAGSKAEKEGLHVGNHLVSINGINIEQLTMVEAQNIIKETRDTLKLGIKYNEGSSNGTINGATNDGEENEKKPPFLDELKVSMTTRDANWGSHHEAKGNTFKSLQEHTEAGLGKKVLTVFDVQVSDRNKSIPILAPRVSVDDTNTNSSEHTNLGWEITMVGGKPWGIRLQGGKDTGFPIQIAQVTTNSKSALVGLQVGDQILSINNTSSNELTLLDAQYLIKETGDKLKLCIKQVQKPSLGASAKWSVDEEDVDDAFYEDLKVSMQGCAVDRSGRNVKGNAFKLLQNIVDSGAVK